MSGARVTGGAADVAAARTAMLVLDPDPAAVRTARSFVREQCAAGGTSEDACDTAVLLVSETVTNAFTHGRSEARISVTIGDGRVLVEVGDDNSRHPRLVEPDGDALDGRGISILEGLAARWGVRDDPYGKVVWFEVGSPAAAPTELDLGTGGRVGSGRPR